jgi:hypothetical protein
VGPQRGFARESLGEPSNFQVVASGSQQCSLKSLISLFQLSTTS